MRSEQTIGKIARLRRGPPAKRRKERLAHQKPNLQNSIPLAVEQRQKQAKNRLDRRLIPEAHGLTGQDGAFGRGIAGHRRDFFQVEAGDEHRGWGYTAPAIHLAFGANEFHLRAQGEVENNLGRAAIELLRELQEGLFPEVLAVGGTPDGDVERFLFDLVGDLQVAEKGAGGTGGNAEGLAVNIRHKFGFRGDQGD
jgi:hypothetical protein